MNSNEISNSLILILTIIWGFKVGYHFNYQRAIDPTIKEKNFFTFYFNFFNFRRSLLLLFPVFFSGSDDRKTKHEHILARKTSISTLLLWGWFIITVFYLSSRAPERMKEKHYDFTKGVPENYP